MKEAEGKMMMDDDRPAPVGDRAAARPEADEDEVIEPWDTSFEGKTVVIGLGNPYMRDDGIGIRAARDLRGRHLGERIFIYEAQGLELSMLWQFKGAQKVIVLDAIRSGEVPGTVTRHVVVPGGGSRLSSLHSLELYDLFDLAADEEGGPLPYPVMIMIGVEPEDCGLGERLTCTVADALPALVKATIKELGVRDPVG